MRMALLLVLIIYINSFAQFVQTNGPRGSAFISVAEANANVYGLTSRNNLFVYNNESWERINVADLYLRKLAAFNGNLYGLGYNSVNKFNEMTGVWEIVLEGYSTGFTISGEKMFAAVNDTVYHSEDGIEWIQTFDSLTTDVESFGDTLVQTLRDISSVADNDSVFVMACAGDFSVTQNGIYVSHDNGQSWFEPEGLESFTRVHKVLYFEDKFYLCSSSGLFVSEDNGSGWTEFTNGIQFEETSKYIQDILIQNGNMFALQYSPSSLYRLSHEEWVPAGNFDNVIALNTYGDDDLIISVKNDIIIFNTTTNESRSVLGELVATNSFVQGVDEDVAVSYSFSAIPEITKDGGDTWNVLPFEVQRLSAGDGRLFFTNSEGVFRSDVEDLLPVKINSNLPSGDLNSISEITYSDGNIFVSFNRTRARTHLSPVWEAGGVYKSTDMGATWSNASSGLTKSGSVLVPVYNLWAFGSTLIASTIDGTFRSANSGASWQRFEDGFQENDRPWQVMEYEGKIFTVTYGNIYFSSPDLTAWEGIEDGLDSTNLKTYYQMFVHGNSLCLFDNLNKSFFLLKGTAWERIELEVPDEFYAINFSSAGNVIYASVIDGGIWKGTIETTTDVADQNNIPERFRLMQNYPNPFNPATTIEYTIPYSLVEGQPAGQAGVGLKAPTSRGEFGKVRIVIYDILGREVAVLVNAYQKSGTYKVSFNAADLTSGIYIYSLETPGMNITKKMILVK